MIKKIFGWLFSPLGRIAIVIGGLAVVSLAVWGISLTQAAPEQPILTSVISLLGCNVCTAILVHGVDLRPVYPARPNAGAVINNCKSQKPVKN